MSTTALVLGGTRYFGKRLVQLLVEDGVTVTVGTRGRAAIDDGRIRHISLDRFDRDSLERGLSDGQWNVVYDQICYAPDDARDICEVLSGRTDRYVMTSSQAVYSGGENLDESAFDPLAHEAAMGGRHDFSYSDGKRHAESFLFRHAPFPVLTLRLPIVLGPDDYTGRLEDLVERIGAGKTVVASDLAAECSLISSHEAAETLRRLGTHGEAGAYNACSHGSLSAARLVELVESATGRSAAIDSQSPADVFSLLPSRSLTLDTAKAQAIGCQFERTEEWLIPLIGNLASLGSTPNR